MLLWTFLFMVLISRSEMSRWWGMGVLNSERQFSHVILPISFHSTTKHPKIWWLRTVTHGTLGHDRGLDSSRMLFHACQPIWTCLSGPWVVDALASHRLPLVAMAADVNYHCLDALIKRTGSHGFFTEVIGNIGFLINIMRRHGSLIAWQWKMDPLT